VDRQIEAIAPTVESLHEHLRAALLANTTRDAVGHAGAAQEAALVILRSLEKAGEGESRDRGRLLDNARLAMNTAIENSERIALATNIDEMRGRLLDVKTQIDYADAYLRAWLDA
jgi:hypothetical protein